MKMESKALTNGVRSPPPPTANGNNGTSSDTAKDNVFTGIYESAHFANIFVEFENDTREMAIDVPDHFVATTKTPPKFPPPFGGGGSGTLRSQSGYYGGGSDDGGGPQSRGSSLSNGHARLSSGSSPSAPAPMSRSHLKIEQDGRLMVNNHAPPVPGRGSNRSQVYGAATPEEQRRIKKYEAEIAKRTAEEGRKQQQDEFLRHSIRNSQKMRALKEQASLRSPPQGAFNAGFSPDSSIHSDNSSLAAHTAADLMALVDRISNSQDILSVHPEMPESLSRIKALFGDARFQKSLLFAQKVSTNYFQRSKKKKRQTWNGCFSNNFSGRIFTGKRKCLFFFHFLQVEKSLNFNQTGPGADIHEVTEDCINYLGTMDRDDDAAELRKLLSRNWIEGMLYAHDKIASSRRVSPMEGTDALLERLSHYAEPNIKIVRIDKTTEPLGATVKNQDDAVLVGRIIRGGTAEASGLLHEGDEILEVNEVELRGKDVNEVCDILANMSGTLTFLVVPTRHHLSSPAEKKFPVVHVKAHIDYDPEDDPYVPCRELGISFQKV